MQDVKADEETPLLDRIRADILEGRYFPGQWLKQAELEQAYDATRADVRGALSLLAERGLVEYAKNQGFRVHDRSPEEIQEIVDMIVALEAAAVPRIIQNATPADISRLRQLAHAFDEKTRTGRHVELRLLNFQFHNALNVLCGNQRMATTIQTLRECCTAGPFLRYQSFDGTQESSREHFAIIDAIETRDVDRLAQLMRQHTTHTV
jgi:DNA-binding GntR family transcriptional regulator